MSRLVPINRAILAYNEHLMTKARLRAKVHQHQNPHAGEGTVRLRAKPLRILTEYCASKKIRYMSNLGYTDMNNIMDAYADSITPRIYASPAGAALNVGLVTYRHFVSFCVEEEMMPAKSVKIIRDLTLYPTSKRKMTVVPEEDWWDMFEISGEHHPRDKAAIAILIFTAMRISELGTLTWGRLDFNAREMEYFSKKKHQEVSRRMEDELRELLIEWRDWYRQNVGLEEPNNPVIPAFRQGGKGASRWRINPTSPIDTRTVGVLVKNTVMKLGYRAKDLVGQAGHLTRRARGNAIYLRTRDIRAVQDVYDHASPETSALYLRHGMTNEIVNEALNQPLLRRGSKDRGVLEYEPLKAIGA